MNETETLADRTIFALDPAGKEISLRIVIGKPYKTNGPAPWKCAHTIEGVTAYERLPDMSGDDAWQVLMNVISLQKMMLNGLLTDGYKLFDKKGGTELEVAWIFGDPPPEEPVPDGEMTAEQLERVAALTHDEILQVEVAIIQNTSAHFRKVARVVGSSMILLCETIPNVPDLFYAERVKYLVERGHLEAQGDLKMMRFSEIRLPLTNPVSQSV